MERTVMLLVTVVAGRGVCRGACLVVVIGMDHRSCSRGWTRPRHSRQANRDPGVGGWSVQRLKQHRHNPKWQQTQRSGQRAPRTTSLAVRDGVDGQKTHGQGQV